MAPMAETFYAIGIDFGTTYSGVAWAWSGCPQDVEVVSRWRSRFSFSSDSPKVPTQICYDRPSSSTSPIAWGYDVPVEAKAISWFKLLLENGDTLAPELRRSRQVERAQQLVFGDGRTAVEMTADYLRLLWRHTIDELVRDRGLPAVNGLPFKVWLTVPAIWDEKARQKMITAARLAGITDRRLAGPTELNLVTEPEAAALAVLNDLRARPDVKRGDVYVVCDAGGGTVDTISYEVTSADSFAVQECVVGNGAMCGGIFIDEGFTRMVRAVLGPKWDKMTPTSRKTMINNEWEHKIKKSFDDSARHWMVMVPPEAFEGMMPKLHRFDDTQQSVQLRAGQLIFARGHVKAIFGDVIAQIQDLVHQQASDVVARLGRAPTAIILVGGLGSSRYLYNVLCSDYQPRGIQVLQPSGTKSWSAVSRGAVMRGLADACRNPPTGVSNANGATSPLLSKVSSTPEDTSDPPSDACEPAVETEDLEPEAGSPPPLNTEGLPHRAKRQARRRSAAAVTSPFRSEDVRSPMAPILLRKKREEDDG